MSNHIKNYIKTGGIGIKTYTEINGLEQNPDINPHRYGQLIYNKAAKNTQ